MNHNLKQKVESSQTRNSLKSLNKQLLNNKRQIHLLKVMKRAAVLTSNSEALLVNLRINLRMQIEIRLKTTQTFRLMNRKHQSQRKECLLDSKKRFNKTKRTVIKLKKLSKSINTEWNCLRRVCSTEKQKDQYKSKMMSTLLKQNLMAAPPQEMCESY